MVSPSLEARRFFLDNVELVVLMDYETVVRRRRMVRNFQTEEMPEGDLRKILDLAQHYPSAGFSQGVAFVAVRDAATRRKLSRDRDMFPRGWPNYVIRAPILIIVCVSEAIYHRRYREPDKLRPDGTEIEWPTPYWFFDAGAASMILLHSAVSLGYAAVFFGFPKSEIEGVKKTLGIPDEFHPVGAVSMGKPAPDKKSPSLKRGRRPYAEVVHFERW